MDKVGKRLLIVVMVFVFLGICNIWQSINLYRNSKVLYQRLDVCQGILDREGEVLELVEAERSGWIKLCSEFKAEAEDWEFKFKDCYSRQFEPVYNKLDEWLER